MNRDIRPFGPLDDVLVLASRLPHAEGDAAAGRSYHMLRFLSTRYRVHVGCFYDPRSQLALTGKLKPLCYESCFVPHAPRLGAGDASLRTNATLAHWITRLLARHRVRSALSIGAPMAAYLLPLTPLRRVADLHLPEPDGASGWGLNPLRRRRAAASLDLLRLVARQFDSVIVGSAYDAARFAALMPHAAARCISMQSGVDADHFSPHIIQRNPYPLGVSALLLAGALDTAAAIDAALWFAQQVFAPMHARDPALHCYLRASRSGTRMRRLARQPGIVFIDPVADARPYLAHAALAVAPQLCAAPPCPHLLQAMAMQTVIVASPAALAPFGDLPHAGLLVAHDAPQFIARISAVLAEPASRGQAIGARAAALAEFRWTERLAPLCVLLDGAGHKGATISV